MLEIVNLCVSIDGRQILTNINLSVKQNMPAILFGPNGSGKSTLLKTVMGFEGFRVTAGDIVFKGKRINDLRTEDRVALGMGIMFQNPPKIRGVRLTDIAAFFNKSGRDVEILSERLSLTGLMKRDLNLGFSGGETKRSELFQVLMQEPDLLLLDEPESGVDLENISIMGRALNDYLSISGKTALMITHTGYILDYVRSENGCVMFGGSLWCVGNPKEMFESICKFGYEKCKECANVQGRHT